MKKFTLISLFLIFSLGINCQTANKTNSSARKGSNTEIRNGVVIDKTAQKIVNDVISQMKKDTPFSFSFTYDIKDEDGKIQGKGTFLSNNSKYVVSADKFSNYSDGKTMWNYIKKSNEAEITDAEDGNTMFNFVKIINTSAKNFRPKLIRQEIFNNIKCNIVDLTPMKNGNISKIRIYSSVTDNRLHKLEISTYSSSKYVYTFSNYNANKKITDKDFVFDKTRFPGVKMIDLR
ncbi:MAG: outer membrane lipoprotein carrier protein LolA [Bacteroidales bacterium]|nr:outer membrane lipoprotein carrier protein LolA [Bacteroidales bacterium]